MGSVIFSLPVVGEMSQPAASIPDCEKRGESVYRGGGGRKQALSLSSLPHQQHTHPDGLGAGFLGCQGS